MASTRTYTGRVGPRPVSTAKPRTVETRLALDLDAHAFCGCNQPGQDFAQGLRYVKPVVTGEHDPRHAGGVYAEGRQALRVLNTHLPDHEKLR